MTYLIQKSVPKYDFTSDKFYTRPNLHIFKHIATFSRFDRYMVEILRNSYHLRFSDTILVLFTEKKYKSSKYSRAWNTPFKLIFKGTLIDFYNQYFKKKDRAYKKRMRLFEND